MLDNGGVILMESELDVSHCAKKNNFPGMKVNTVGTVKVLSQ